MRERGEEIAIFGFCSRLRPLLPFYFALASSGGRQDQQQRPNISIKRLTVAASSAKYSLDVSVDGELTSGEGTNHDEPGTHAGEETTETKLLGDLDEAASGRLAGEGLGLVDLGQKGVGRLRDKGGAATGDDTTGEVEAGDGARGELLLLLASRLDEGLKGNFEEVELGHSVRDLLEENGTEAARQRS